MELMQLSNVCCTRWLEDYCRLVCNPQSFCQEKGFNKATDSINSFHVISSLDLTDNPNMKAAIRELHSMLEFNELQMMPYDDILELAT